MAQWRKLFGCDKLSTCERIKRCFRANLLHLISSRPFNVQTNVLTSIYYSASGEMEWQSSRSSKTSQLSSANWIWYSWATRQFLFKFQSTIIWWNDECESIKNESFFNYLPYVSSEHLNRFFGCAWNTSQLFNVNILQKYIK